MDTQEGKHLHDLLGFVGLRAHATAVGLVTLSIELHKTGALDEAALERIKQAIFHDLALSRPRSRAKAEFEASLQLRLDRLFSGQEQIAPDSAAMFD